MSRRNISFTFFSLTYLIGWAPNARAPRCLQQSIVDDAVDQWRKRLRYCVETSGRHFEHLL